MKPASRNKIKVVDFSKSVKSTIVNPNTVVVQEEKKLLTMEDLLNIDLLDKITDNSEINQKIKEKALEYANFSAKSTIWLGKHLTEVFDLLSTGNTKEESKYLKYLEYINLNERTARRYRKRYKLYENIPTETGKKLILNLSDNDIQLLENQPELLVQIDKCNTKEEFLNLKQGFLLENAKQLALENKQSNVPEMPKISINDIGSRIETLYLGLPNKHNIDEKKLSLLEKYLEKIEKLLAE
ncbi:hypothetical protein [uncultured Fusobacterium sp.]|uniref:hypothetical protein n=1 Tax=uncultured Fusobacterium sp. TaxID=159267 RepID=UPI0025DAF7E1|nr:hypothetical protein [uncultured Fusobacterium sp.]